VTSESAFFLFRAEPDGVGFKDPKLTIPSKVKKAQAIAEADNILLTSYYLT